MDEERAELGVDLIKQEALDRKRMQAWDNFLTFFCLEVLGEEIFEYYRSGRGTLQELEPKDIPLDLALADHEVKIWRMKDAITAYLKEKEPDLTLRRIKFLSGIGAGLGSIFWAMCRSQREASRIDTLGIRRGGPMGVQLCSIPPEGGANPLAALLSKIVKD